MSHRTPPAACAAADAISGALLAASDAGRASWWHDYLKRALPFHGVPMAGVREIVNDTVAGRSSAHLRAVALEMLGRPVGEEKLAGVLVLAEHLAPLRPAAGPLLRDLADAFDREDIADWNTCDWLCVKVIGPLVGRDGESPAHLVAAWTEAPGLWLRRAGVVGLVSVANRGDDLFPGFTDLILGACDRLAVSEERFAQTAIGWVLRELSDVEPERVAGFVADRRDLLSREAIRMAASRLSDSRRAALGVTGRRRRR